MLFANHRQYIVHLAVKIALGNVLPAAFDGDYKEALEFLDSLKDDIAIPIDKVKEDATS